MLCDKCQKREARVFLSYAASESKIVDGVRKCMSLPSQPSRQLCPECAETDEEANQQPTPEPPNLDDWWKTNGGRPEFFTEAFQQALIERVERESPEILNLRREGEEFDTDKFRPRYEALQEKLKGEIARELAARGSTPGKAVIFMMTTEILGGAYRRCMERKRATREHPGLTRVEVDKLIFIGECCHVALQVPRKKKYDGLRAREILAVAGEVARKIYGAGAQEELRKMGITSSATFGERLYELVEKGFIGKEDEDRPEDFQVRSAFDEFLEKG